MNNEFKESKDLFKEATVSFGSALKHSAKTGLITSAKYIKTHKVFDTIAIGLVLYIIMITQIVSYRTQEQSISVTIMNLNDTISDLKQENEFLREKNIVITQRLDRVKEFYKENHPLKTKRNSYYRHFNHNKKDSI